MTGLKNITTYQLIKSDEATIKSYTELLDMIKPSNVIRVKRYKLLPYFKRDVAFNVNKMKYDEVKYCINMIYGSITWEAIKDLFEVCFGLNDNQFFNLKVVELFKAKNYIVQELDRIVKVETKMLSSTTATDTHMWDMAGADRLKPFNDLSPLMQLGKELGQYPYDLGKKPYNEILSMLAQLKTRTEVETEYQRLISK